MRFHLFQMTACERCREDTRRNTLLEWSHCVLNDACSVFVQRCGSLRQTLVLIHPQAAASVAACVVLSCAKQLLKDEPMCTSDEKFESLG